MPGRKIELIRPQELTKNIVIVDGMPHVGKQLVAQFISTIKRGEISILNPVIDNLCIANAFGKIRHDATNAIINLFADMDLYNLMISRCVNFRKTDDTGVSRNLVTARYQQRLLLQDGDPVVERIRQTSPILTYMTHHLFGISQPVFDAFAKRLKLFIVCVRHPLWVVEMWTQKKWGARIGHELREFQMCCRTGTKTVPWFVGNALPNYLKMSPVEQAIAILNLFHDRYREQVRKISPAQRAKVWFVPYERFTANPWPYLRRVAARLKSCPTELSRRVAKSFSFPRPCLASADITGQLEKVGKMMRAENTPRSARRTLDCLCSSYEQYLRPHNKQGIMSQ